MLKINKCSRGFEENIQRHLMSTSGTFSDVAFSYILIISFLFLNSDAVKVSEFRESKLGNARRLKSEMLKRRLILK
jgi:hypothetical protein